MFFPELQGSALALSDPYSRHLGSDSGMIEQHLFSDTVLELTNPTVLSWNVSVSEKPPSSDKTLKLEMRDRDGRGVEQ